ncbi:MAG TPA: MFS transporter [Candidatus Baltobacteraceae bacterium]|jgi:putative MFS transporter|nr:MFS transporter [Candidatus Baltobacteraceae bacterium]
MRSVVLRISAGGWFELYDLFMTAYISLGLIKDGLFVATAPSPFALWRFAWFIASGFAGMFAGTLVFGWFADQFGRKNTFVVSLLWYSAATVGMALAPSAVSIDLWRFVAGIGIGVQLVTIDSYISEISPKDQRGYWIAFSQFIGYLAIPVVALAAYLLVPHHFFGLSGWRYVALVGSLGGVVVWFLRSGLPESPRWHHARHAAGAAAIARAWSAIWSKALRVRTIMLVVFNFAQTIGFYGFTSWVPIFVASHGVSFAKSLQYSFIIAAINPAGPLLAMRMADRWQRKWQIVVMACIIAIAGLAFALVRAPGAIIAFGIIVTLANAWFSCAFHAYQAELYPTPIRAQAVGFVYSWSRFSSIFVGFAIAAVLRAYGTPGVFALIACAMAIVAVTIGTFGIRTNNMELEDLAVAL